MAFYLNTIQTSESPVHIDVREITADQARQLGQLPLELQTTIATMVEFGWNRGYKKGFDAGFENGQQPSESYSW